MASIGTIRKTNKIIDRLVQILGPFADRPLPVMLNQKGKILTKEWRGELAERRRKQGPGIVELIYHELPQQILREFVTNAPTAQPTKEEFTEFEKRFLTTARRIISREITKRLNKLPDSTKKPRGRPRRTQKQIELVQRTVEELKKKKKMGSTAAVREAAKILGEGGTPRHPDTIWKYLRVGKTKPSAR